MTYFHLLRRKSETLAAYKDFEAEIDTQHGARVKVLHSDRGGEYTGKSLLCIYGKNGTKQKLLFMTLPQHNGVAECLNRTILEKVSVRGLPIYFHFFPTSPSLSVHSGTLPEFLESRPEFPEPPETVRSFRNPRRPSGVSELHPIPFGLPSPHFEAHHCTVPSHTDSVVRVFLHS